EDGWALRPASLEHEPELQDANLLQVVRECDQADGWFATMMIKQGRWTGPLYLWLAGIVLVLISLIHTWALGYSLRKRGSVEPEWCPEIPSYIPQEVGFGYEVSALLLTVHCVVRSKEAGWSHTQQALLIAVPVSLVIGAALLLIGVVLYVRRRAARSVASYPGSVDPA